MGEGCKGWKGWKVEKVANACLNHDTFVHELHKGTRIVYLHELANAGLLAFDCLGGRSERLDL